MVHATEKWAEIGGGGGSEPNAQVDLDPDVVCLIKVQVLCDTNKSFRANEKVSLSLLLKNCAAGDNPDLEALDVTHSGSCLNLSPFLVP